MPLVNSAVVNGVVSPAPVEGRRPRVRADPTASVPFAMPSGVCEIHQSCRPCGR